ncbi:Glutaredoxin-like domain protein [Fervidobacterium changbaicum]|uniref:Glutaredoxin n=1 Tax=Fervidobacterium changbaicum TaxID=310769 RepID=A0ABX5QR89_9BACT|nr:thioredoxin family protein [Fervidobacterium changbaicum]QAV32888.1 glutaredoxin [Fervidobacterium changbaicum]SDH74864.1 Glutaredoxin-like domain protein [Fervidobacterium changbaicum]
MGLLQEKDRKYLQDLFAKELKNGVKLIFFHGEDCEYCDLESQLLDEVKELSDKITVEKYHKDSEKAKEYNVEFVPALIVTLEDGKDRGVRFYGIPSGHEFGTLIQIMTTFGNNATPQLSPSTVETLKNLDKPVKISVFVTPTCPYCPRAALTAFNMALASDMVTAEVIEANEFFDLSEQFGVSSVPHIAINRNPDKFFIGAYPEPQFLQQVLDLAE